MKILIVNQPPYNRGDESAHKGLIRSLLKRCPNIQIKVLYHLWTKNSIEQYAISDSRVEYIPSFYGRAFLYEDLVRKHIRIDNWGVLPFVPLFKPYAEIYRWADLVLSAPGGICMGGFQDWDHLIHLIMAKSFKKPLAYYGRSFGPFPTETKLNREFKKKSLEMLHYFSFLSIRDHKTEQLAQQLKIKYVPTVDSAFLDDTMVEIPENIRHEIGNDYMVFVPNYLLWHYAYKGRFTKESIIAFYCKLIDVIKNQNPNIKIVMLPQLFGLTYYESNDFLFFQDIKKASTYKNNIVILSDMHGSDVQQAIIREAKYLIGARYHSIVFAVNQNTPFISMSYEHKMSGMLETLNKKEWCVDFTTTMDTEERQEKCIQQIQSLIPHLKRDEQLSVNAKKIANRCMDEFIRQCIHD